MKLLINYILSFCSSKRYSRFISIFSCWNSTCIFSKKVYISLGVRLGNVSIGKYSRIRYFSTIYHAEIGNYSEIARNVRIGIGQHPTNLLSINSIFYRKKEAIRKDWVRPINFQEYKKTIIGNDVWIGADVVIMGGITIGDGAIVATRSVVTKDVPPYAIVAGVPAKVVKYRFDEEKIATLLKIKWWNLPDELIEEKIEAFTIFDISNEKIEKYFCQNNIEKMSGHNIK